MKASKARLPSIHIFSTRLYLRRQDDFIEHQQFSITLKMKKRTSSSNNKKNKKNKPKPVAATPTTTAERNGPPTEPRVIMDCFHKYTTGPRSNSQVMMTQLQTTGKLIIDAVTLNRATLSPDVRLNLLQNIQDSRVISAGFDLQQIAYGMPQTQNKTAEPLDLFATAGTIGHFLGQKATLQALGFMTPTPVPIAAVILDSCQQIKTLDLTLIESGVPNLAQ
jgi:hypothetical protein